MRQFVVSEAPVSRVAQHVRDTVEDAGGIVAHHTAAKTEFDHLDHGDQAWRRAGYVGTYERFKEKPVQVRIRVWAQWPRRLLAGSIYVGFFLALLFFLASLVGLAIPPNVWIFSSLPILALVAIAYLMYTSSMADSEGAERRIEAGLVERINEDEAIPGEVYDVDDWEEYRDTLVEDAREEARERAPQGGSRLRDALASFGGGDEPGDAERAEADDADEAADEGPGAVASLKGKLGLDSEEDAEDETDEADDEGQAEPAQADVEEDEAEVEASEPEDEVAEAEPEEPAETTAEEPAEDETQEETGALSSIKTTLGLRSDEGPDDESGPEADEADEAEEAEEADEGEGALAGLTAKLGFGDEDEEPDADEAEPVEEREGSGDAAAT